MNPGEFAFIDSPRRRIAAMLKTMALVGSLSMGWLAHAAPPKSASASPSPLAAAASAPATSANPVWPIQTGVWVHAISAFQPAKYPANYTHFDYVNPDAPKGGVVHLGNPDRRSSFDKYNYYTLKGNAPMAMDMLVFERLAVFSMDEPQAMYGLLAEAMYVAPDMRSMSFRLRPGVRFNDGSPLTAADVVHSFQQLTSKGASPLYRNDLAGIRAATAIDDRTVRFDFHDAKVAHVFTIGDLRVFSRRWGAGKPFDQIVTEWPIATGPYTLDKAQMPSRLELKRRPDYWGLNAAPTRGMFNFDRIVYRMYKDADIKREAFKAGEFDIMREMRSSQFARGHRGAKWDDGRIVKKSFPVQTGNMMGAFDFNLRRPQLQDIRVREAINLAWDFETYNKRAYNTFQPANSMFNNSEFAAVGPPSAEELKLLEPFRAELPPRVFGPAYLAPRTDAHPNALRDNLKRAAQLLAEAGWKVGDDGWLRNAKGETLDIEYLEAQDVGRFQEFARNMKKLGIRYTERLVDFALFRRRLERFDYDMVAIVEGKFTLPDAGTLEQLYGSKGVKEEGSGSYRGVNSKAVDALIEKIGQANTLDELRTAARALDRVVMWNYWQVPYLYKSTESVSYWNRFGMPTVLPKYYQIDSLPDVHSLPWPVWTWWDKALDAKAAAKP